MIRTRWASLLGAAVIMFAAQFGAVLPEASAQQRITMKGGQIRGAYNRWTSAYAVYLTKELKGVQVSSESSTGSSENVRAVNSGSVEIALTFSSDS